MNRPCIDQDHLNLLVKAYDRARGINGRTERGIRGETDAYSGTKGIYLFCSIFTSDQMLFDDLMEQGFLDFRQQNLGKESHTFVERHYAFNDKGKQTAEHQKAMLAL